MDESTYKLKCVNNISSLNYTYALRLTHSIGMTEHEHDKFAKQTTNLEIFSNNVCTFPSSVTVNSKCVLQTLCYAQMVANQLLSHLHSIALKKIIALFQWNNLYCIILLSLYFYYNLIECT